MSQQRLKLVNASTNILELKGLKDEITKDYLEDATVTATLFDDAGVAVPGAEDIDLLYVAGTPATYRGSLSYTLTLTTGGTYTATITATAADASVRTIPVGVDVVDLP